ncbi:uncharacterized protein LOC119457460 isoform X2 [Dermacentor silvarum]|uniref:uncharacterized protein LOC119457460 isoform X2 n=1 Tax=Dermacentor silvarum TaxID=543639 RepID=UPI0021015719|nr:uncharacterized protein LOC119457460 isoform X2 [Dermacentor silvarum]
MTEAPEKDTKPHPSDIKAVIGEYELTTSQAGHAAASAESATAAGGAAPQLAPPTSLVPSSAKSPTIDMVATPLENNLSKEAQCGSRAAKDSNDASMTASALQRVLSPPGPASPPPAPQKKLEIIMGTKPKKSSSSPTHAGAMSPSFFDDDDMVSTTSSVTAFRERMRAVRLEVIRHKGIIATTAVTAFCFATYFILVAVLMMVMYAVAERPEDRVSARMGFNPINIAVTLMAMGVGCSALALALAFSIEDINWA